MRNSETLGHLGSRQPVIVSDLRPDFRLPKAEEHNRTYDLFNCSEERLSLGLGTLSRNDRATWMHNTGKILPKFSPPGHRASP